MSFTRTALLLAAATGLAAIATPAPAQESWSSAPAYTHNGAPTAPARRHKNAYAVAIPSTATAEYVDSSCHLEFFDTGVHWKSYQTMCGPR